MTKPHPILIPYPAQGHVLPMLELARHLASHGLQVTFVNTEFNHRRVIESLSQASDNTPQVVNMVSISDGMEPWEDRKDLTRLTAALSRVAPRELEALIKRINEKEGEGGRVTCLVADPSILYVLEIAERLGLGRAAFWPGSAAMLAMAFSIPKLINDGMINMEGKLLKNKTFRLSPDMLLMNSTDLTWTCMPNQALQKTIFDVQVMIQHSIKLTNWIICNSTLDLEPETFSWCPKILPIGPLLASSRVGRSVGHLWLEDPACLTWLDQQRPNSVIYVSFGSFTVFNETQFKELIIGLELVDRPFLWVVRHESVDKSYQEELKERLRDRGRVVGWAPQQEVLSHPSVACFISHCGWNSTIESIANGVPLLCWPYFGDQFLNRTYICDEWKVGLRLNKDEYGIVRRDEIKDKVERLLHDKSYKERVKKLQTKVKDSIEKGQSCKNFKSFVEWIKNSG